MEKAYDIKAYLEKLKGLGLNVGEELAKQLFICTLDWVSESAKLSNNPVDDFIIAAVAPMKETILKLVDKIDGQEG
jgi:hypothetical protein